jgi:hypothetical protein
MLFSVVRPVVLIPSLMALAPLAEMSPELLMVAFFARMPIA